MKSTDGVMAAAAEVERYCRSQDWKFCFIGGVAVQRWGMPRFTQDVDATLFVGFGEEAIFVDKLLAQYEGRLRNARQFALERRVLLARTRSGVDLDFALGAFPFEEASIRRASRWKVSPTIELTTCSAEDLVVHKVFAGRDRDWADVESVLIRQMPELKLSNIRRELETLLEIKEDFESAGKFERMIEQIKKRLF